jgi:glutamate dehydrogenase/leucine dehydrogenase
MARMQTSVFEPGFEHEHVQLFHDAAVGLTGVIAIHSTALGPAVGGLRIWPYPDTDSAVGDALRLSAAMTLKSAAAGLDLGGGKTVILDRGKPELRAERMRRFGEVLEQLGGRYVSAEDVGTSAADMDLIAEQTRWVVGRSLERGGRGDPSCATARTVFGSIDRAVALQLGAASLDGVTVCVLGAGKVGAQLVELLASAGASVIVTDLDPDRAAAAAHAGATAVTPNDFLARDCDVLAPCALGGVIGVEHVRRLRCRVIAGAANNPLEDRATALALARRDILYVPDFVANCGGIIHVGAELLMLDDSEVERRIAKAIDRSEEILLAARDSQELPLDVARRLALQRIHDAGERVPSAAGRP